MACAIVFTMALLAVASGWPVDPANTCSLDITVNTDGAATVQCQSTCPTGDNGFSFSGVAYKKFAELDALNKMVRIRYAGGNFAGCDIVTLQSDDELSESIAAIQEECSAIEPAEPEPQTATEPAEPEPQTSQPEPQTTVEPAEPEPEPQTSQPEPQTAVEPAEPEPLRTRCREGFTRIGEACYLVTPYPQSQSDGAAICGALGGSTASIESQEEQEALAKHITTDVWLALSDAEEEGRWLSDNREITYTNWNSGEPNDLDDEDCAAMLLSTGLTWNDADCNIQYRTLCKDELIAVYEEPTCPEGQTRFEDSCYFFSSRNNWGTATPECANTPGGYAAFINSEAEMDFIAGFLEDEFVYLSYNDMSSEGTFASDKFGVPLITRYGEGEPNNDLNKEHCIEMRQEWNYAWNDVDCGHWNRVLCEAPAATAA